MVWYEINIGGRTKLVCLNQFLTILMYLDTILQSIVHTFEDTISQDFHQMHGWLCASR